MLEESGSLALRTRMYGLLKRAFCPGSIFQFCDTLLSIVQGFPDTGRRGASDYIMAVKRRLQGDAIKKVSIKFHAKFLKFRQRKIAKFAAFVEAVADCIADFFVGFTKGYSFIDQI